MILRLCWSGLVILFALLPFSPAYAEGEDVATTIPTVGIPYASTTGSGSFFVGTVDIDEFVSKEDGLVAQGLLRFDRRAVPAEFPVSVLRADCFALELEVGPPDFRGLKDPLRILETPGESELRQADFCRFAPALAEGDFDELASLLNEEDLLDAGFLGGNSCPWYKKIGCGTVFVACAASCAATGGAACLACLAAVGGLGCLNCFLP